MMLQHFRRELKSDIVERIEFSPVHTIPKEYIPYVENACHIERQIAQNRDPLSYAGHG